MRQIEKKLFFIWRVKEFPITPTDKRHSLPESSVVINSFHSPAAASAHKTTCDGALLRLHFDAL